MLRQILETMYVDPELLELMSVDQRELLFRKMREEQLRRWKVRERELEKKKPWPKRTPRKIQFLLGADGEPWTWVMGEHSSDLAYDELARQRERREREREEEEERQLRREAEEFAKLETGHILSLASRFGELHSPSISPRVSKRLSLDSGQPRAKPAVRRLVSDSAVASAGRMSLAGPLLTVPESLSLSSSMPRTESQLDLSGSTDHIDGPDSPSIRQHSSEDLRRRALAAKKQVPVIGKTKEEQHQFQARRAEEIYTNIREVKKLEKERSHEVERSVEERWRESEQKAKAFERTRKASFNKARQLSKKHHTIDERQILEGIPEERKKELERKLSVRSRPSRKPLRPSRPAPTKPMVRQSSIVLPDTRPKTQGHVVTWFREMEAPRGICRERNGTISLWFHGRLSRTQAETILKKKPVGSYLVRLSVKIWGYTISVKTYADVKHFLVDASLGQYQFLGTKQQQFHSLLELMVFYRGNPITTAGQEFLLVPVAQLESEESENFAGLFRDHEEEEMKSTYL